MGGIRKHDKHAYICMHISRKSGLEPQQFQQVVGHTLSYLHKAYKRQPKSLNPIYPYMTPPDPIYPYITLGCTGNLL